jgi:hypothetical protein
MLALRLSRCSFNGYFLATSLQMDDALKAAGPRQGIVKSDGVNVS